MKENRKRWNDAIMSSKNYKRRCEIHDNPLPPELNHKSGEVFGDEYQPYPVFENNLETVYLVGNGSSGNKDLIKDLEMSGFIVTNKDEYELSVYDKMRSLMFSDIILVDIDMNHNEDDWEIWAGYGYMHSEIMNVVPITKKFKLWTSNEEVEQILDAGTTEEFYDLLHPALGPRGPIPIGLPISLGMMLEQLRI